MKLSSMRRGEDESTLGDGTRLRKEYRRGPVNTSWRRLIGAEEDEMAQWGALVA